MKAIKRRKDQDRHNKISDSLRRNDLRYRVAQDEEEDDEDDDYDEEHENLSELDN